jgi:high-affinity K+ transport system ATPase subunit B
VEHFMMNAGQVFYIAQAKSIWDPQIVRRAISDSFRKLHPHAMARNP